MAQPTKCVNDSFSDLDLSCRLNAARTAHRRETSISRNDVAVGTSSDASMFWRRRRAGPDRGAAETTESAEATEGLSLLASVAFVRSIGTVVFSNNFRHSSGTDDGSRR